MIAHDRARPRTTMYDRVQSYVLMIIYYDYNWSCKLDARRNHASSTRGEIQVTHDRAQSRTVAHSRARSSTVMRDRTRSSAVMRNGARLYTTVYDHARWCTVVHGYARQVEIHLTGLAVLLFLSNTNLHSNHCYASCSITMKTQLISPSSL